MENTIFSGGTIFHVCGHVNRYNVEYRPKSSRKLLMSGKDINSKTMCFYVFHLCSWNLQLLMPSTQTCCNNSWNHSVVSREFYTLWSLNMSLILCLAISMKPFRIVDSHISIKTLSVTLMGTNSKGFFVFEFY